MGGLILATLGSCKKDNDYEDVPIAIVTAVNGFVSANGVRYVQDNNYIPFLDNYLLLYKSYGSYQQFAGTSRTRILDDANQVLVDDSYTFKENTYYTSFIYGWQEDIRHLMTEDKILANLGNQSAFRFLHLSPIESKVNVYLDNKESILYADRTYQGGNDAEENENIVFVSQSSGEHTIIVTKEDNETLVERTYTFKAGYHYTFILIGDGSMARPLYLGIIEQYKPSQK